MVESVVDRVKAAIAADPISAFGKLLNQTADWRSGRAYFLRPDGKPDTNPGYEVKYDGGCFDGSRYDGDVLKVFARCKGLDTDNKPQFMEACERADRMLHATPPGQKKTPSVGARGVKENTSANVSRDTHSSGEVVKGKAKPVAPVPLDAPPMPDEHPHYGKPDEVFPLIKAGRLYGAEYRWNENEQRGKVCRPVFYFDCDHEHEVTKNKKTVTERHKAGWCFHGNPDNLPLWGVDELLSGKTGTIYIHEGPGKRIAAAADYPDDIHLAWFGGANRVSGTDWSPIPLGAQIIGVPDADEAGHKAREDYSQLLWDEGHRNLLTLDTTGFPKGADYASHPELFRKAMENPQTWKPPTAPEVVEEAESEAPEWWQPVTAADLMKVKYPAVDWVLPNLIPEGVTILSAPPKVGKTFFCEALALSIAEGTEFLGALPRKQRVLYLDGEQTGRLIQRRFKTLGWHDGSEGLTMNSMLGKTMGKKEIEWLENQIRGKFDLVILDTIGRTLVKPKNSGDAYNLALGHVGPFHDMCNRLGISAIMIHHVTKAKTEGGESYDDISGGYGYASVVDNLLTFKRHDADSFKVTVTGRIEAETEFLLRKEDNARWRRLDGAEMQQALESKMTDQQQSVLKVMRETPWLCPKVIAAVSGVKIGTVKPMLKSWAQSGKVMTKPNGRSTLYSLVEPKQEEAVDEIGF